MSKKFRYFINASIIAASTLLILVACEIIVRLTTDLQFLGVSKDLLSNERFGDSFGNTPFASTQAFAKPVHIDNQGFRIPEPDYQYPSQAKRKILFIGDSVAFGIGVREGVSFVGRLRSANPDWLVHNSAVIGHSAKDYFNVGNQFLKDKLSYDHVFIIICLNDTEYNRSAKNIIERNRTEAPQSGMSLLFELKKFGHLQALNDFLKQKSKTYLLLKNLLFDTSKEYLQNIYPVYHSEGVQRLEPVRRLIEKFRKRGVDPIVLIMPFEYQVRQAAGRKSDSMSLSVGNRDVFLPQRKIIEYLSRHGIVALDMAPAFLKNLSVPTKELYLTYDPMHLSKLGHELAFQFIQKRIGNNESTKRGTRQSATAKR